MRSPDLTPLRDVVYGRGELVDDSQAHASGAAFDNFHSSVYIERIQVVDLGLGNLSNLRTLDAADYLKTCGSRTFFYPCGLPK